METPAPDFSIITPSFNYGHYIGDCLESVAKQRGVTFEHLIFDAGSTDDTMEVISGFPDVQVVQEKDNGMSDAINKGFAAARGKWVMWLNADDLLKPGALKAILTFAKDTDYDVVYAGWDFVDEERKFKRRMTVFPFRRKAHCYLVCYIASTSAFYRRETVINEGHFLNEDFRYVMDGEFYNRLASKGKKFGYLHAVIADFRLHGGNLSLRHRNKENRSASEELERQKQFAESVSIIRCYGQQKIDSPPLVWLVDGALVFLYRIQKFFLKRFYGWFFKTIPLENPECEREENDSPE